MQYWIWLKSKKTGDPYVYYGALLPGIIPDRVFDLMVDNQVPELTGMCKQCPWHGCICHVIEAGSGRKFCPVLFHDAVRPAWKIEDIV